jgi:hypothetical protein
MSMAAELITRPGSVHRGLKLGHDEDLGDCEAFLLGQLAEYKEAHYQYVASWEWTNLLAHGSEDDLRVELATAAIENPVGTRPTARGVRLAHTWRPSS